MILIADHLQDILEKHLREAGLAKFYDRGRSQYLDLDGEVFAEVVLVDGSVLDEVERLVRKTAEELAKQAIRIDSIVRAFWEIESVEYSGRSRTPDLSQYRAAAEFRVVLRSGSRQHQVFVDVFWGAIDVLRHKLGMHDGAESHESDLPDGRLLSEMVGPAVRQFLEQQLARGGTSYWNPLLPPYRVDLTDTDMSFLLGQSTTFDELRQAISDAFDPPVLESFLRSLSTAGAKFRDFDAVLPLLSGMLGGAYRSTDTFSINARELYQRLERTEQELLKKYFEGKIEQLRSDPRFAVVVDRFSDVLS
jgi:hypothetical protein